MNVSVVLFILSSLATKVFAGNLAPSTAPELTPSVPHYVITIPLIQVNCISLYFNSPSLLA